MISLFLPVFWLMSSYVGNRFTWKVVLETSTVPSKQHCCDSGGEPSSAQPQSCPLDVRSHDGFSDFLQWQLLVAFSCSLPLTNSLWYIGTGTQTAWRNCPLPPLLKHIFGSYCLLLPILAPLLCQVCRKKRGKKISYLSVLCVSL